MANLDKNTGAHSHSKEAGVYEVVAARAEVVVRALGHIDDSLQFVEMREIPAVAPTPVYDPATNTYEVNQTPYAATPAPISSEVSYDASANTLDASIISQPAMQETVDPRYLDAIGAE